MKPFAFPPARRLAVVVTMNLCLLVTCGGCGRNENTRPASSLSARDRATLDRYEQIRAALADDDLRTAKTAAGTLVKLLQPTDDKAAAVPALGPASDIVAAPALDRARQKFKNLSAKVIPLAEGVEGYYVMTCPVPSAGDWVQHGTQVDNPYFGRTMHAFGELKK